jgi:hypothetical protein
LLKGGCRVALKGGWIIVRVCSIFNRASFLRRADEVAVAQLVRAPGCGPGGRGFESPRSPQL